MTIKITCNTCDTIEESCKQAVQLAIKNNEDVVFEFNSIEVRASPESNYDDLITEYRATTLALFFYNKLTQPSLLIQYLYDSENNK